MAAIADFQQFISDSVKAGLQQCLRFGVTAVGDITLNPATTRPLLAAAEMRGVSFGEVLGMAQRIDQMDSRIAAAIDRSSNNPFFRAGIEPHAPYSLDLTGYRQCLQVAREQNLPLATHLAETLDEAPFLADHTGPFRRLWQVLNAWSDNVSRNPGGPIRAMQALGLLDYPTLLAHVNFADDDELKILAHSQASIVYCPRTHACFNHPPHPFETMLQLGINVAIGTDSCASSPDLNIVDDLRLIHRARPHLPPQLLWSLVTTRAAAALGMTETIGQLAPNHLPDLCVFEIHTNDPLNEILENNALPKQLWRNGCCAIL
jgi:cytosine/adenosine deaminase-related metal-dependent hydrolase